MIGNIFCLACIFVMSLFIGAYVDHILGGNHGQYITDKIDRAYHNRRGYMARIRRIGRKGAGRTGKGRIFIKLK